MPFVLHSLISRKFTNTRIHLDKQNKVSQVPYAPFCTFRSSSTAATAAFAAATAGSANPKDHPKGISRYHSAGWHHYWLQINIMRVNCSETKKMKSYRCACRYILITLQFLMSLLCWTLEIVYLEQACKLKDKHHIFGLEEETVSQRC